MTTAVDSGVKAAFNFGNCVRAELMRHLRRFGFRKYAALLGRRSSPMLSGAEIHELRLRAVGWTEDDYDILGEYNFSD